jgi:hypothetical protein
VEKRFFSISIFQLDVTSSKAVFDLEGNSFLYLKFGELHLQALCIKKCFVSGHGPFSPMLHPTGRSKSEKTFFQKVVEISRIYPLNIENVNIYYRLFGPNQWDLVELCCEYFSHIFDRQITTSILLTFYHTF